MSENIPLLVDEYFKIILGKKGSGQYTDDEKNNIIKSFELVVNKLPVHTPNLRATNTEQVLKLLRRGKVTIAEAKELMAMMATDFEINSLPDLLAKFEELNRK